MNLKDKRYIVSTLIALAKSSNLNTNQNDRVLKAVNSLKNATDIQKERFINYYGFDGTGSKKLVDVAKMYKKTVSTIRGSAIAIELKLARSDEAFDVIEKIVNECFEKV